MLCYMCGPHARSRVPPPSSSWYFTRYFLVAFLIPLQLRPGILKGIPDNKISFMPLSCQHCPTWYYYHYHLFNHSTYFCPLYAQNDSSIPSKTQPTACLMLPWVSLGPTLATEAAPAGAREPRDVCVWVDRNCRQAVWWEHGHYGDCTAPTLGNVWTAPPEEDSNQSPISHGQFYQRAEVTSAVEFTYYIPYFFIVSTYIT